MWPGETNSDALWRSDLPGPFRVARRTINKVRRHVPAFRSCAKVVPRICRLKADLLASGLSRIAENLQARLSKLLNGHVTEPSPPFVAIREYRNPRLRLGALSLKVSNRNVVPKARHTGWSGNEGRLVFDMSKQEGTLRIVFSVLRGAMYLFIFSMPIHTSARCRLTRSPE